MRFQVPALGVLLLAAVGCSNEPMASEEPEVEEGTDALTSGTIDCALRSDTGYEDGNPFSIQVVTVDGKAVERRTANAFDHLRRSARLDGIDVIVVSGFRTMTEQERLWRCFQECSCNNCNPANPPGTSNHQSGSALDLNTADDGVYDWLASNAPNFRFHRTVSREPWHWEYEGGFSDDRPCGTEEASGAEVHFLEPVSGALVHGVAGVRVTAPARTHHVVYSEGGRVIGASEDASNYFLARATFSGAGARELTAVAYDVN